MGGRCKELHKRITSHYSGQAAECGVLEMDNLALFFIVILFMTGFIYFILSVFILHGYELKTKKMPWHVMQFWPFYSEMKELYPLQSKFAQILVYIAFTGTSLLIIIEFLN